MKGCKPKPQNGGDGNPPPNSPASGGGRNAEVDVKGRKSLNVRPHVAQNDDGRRSAIHRRTTRHAGYVIHRPSLADFFNSLLGRLMTREISCTGSHRFLYNKHTFGG